ncbi:hypothetical protein CSV77_04200 [Sporosarcina sp. P16b]|nr:hypothetical protein CSV77_04200 [Sporosarcina sp. P16b]
MIILKFFIILLGIGAFISSFFYNKEEHKKFGENTSSAASDSIIITITWLIFSFLLSIAPWWIVKFLLMLIGACLIYSGIFLI